MTIQSYAFSLFRYAQAHPNDIKIKEIDVAESIKRAVYIPPYKRKESGSIGEQAVFGTWKVSRGEQEFVVVAVSVCTKVNLVAG